MSSNGFKVIIVGGGPVGLTAANALFRAGIDFVLLESRPNIVVDAGSNLVLLPMGLRFLAQIGVLDAFNNVSSPLGKIKRFDHDGNNLGDANFFIHYQENHGISPRVVSRHALTQVLYDALPSSAHTRMHPNKKVDSINTTPTSATVHCTDGTSYTGTLIIGADGAHSLIRSQMRTLALAHPSTPASAINPSHPFLTTYRSLWIRFPTTSDLLPGDANETHGVDLAIQTFVGEETSVIGMYERLPQPTTERLRFGPDDEKDFISRWGNLPLSEKVTVRDAYESRVQSGLVSLEEGVVPNWSWDRIVLVGDAAHKFTPSTGAGCNNGMVDVVALVNELARVNTSDGEPEMEEIARAFVAYQKKRFGAVVEGCKGAGQATATATWKSGVFKFVDLHVISSKRVQRFFMQRAAAGIAATPALEFVEEVGLPEGRVPWVGSQGKSIRV
ncbi:FAD/NAD(P)-binding domain-containing protein [Podospora aff. communis PSN243]|uniref:FAD/NAD(P)-binding domain-containing protein n=1 Tax=Podospora aff. communis PSN243 TaxID=3040156 RepID=A0AAV9G7V7_9PEZI|nr:FAD/NAD(P)-binding domain-containing protein [Podospora aff. communis PSN243]